LGVTAINRSKTDVSKFKCTKCGYRLNADHNAAINILRLGLKVA